MTYSCDTPLDRNDIDIHPVDFQGQRLLDLCKNSQLRILNGRTYGDRIGMLTRLPLATRETPGTVDYISTEVEILNTSNSFRLCLNTSV